MSPDRNPTRHDRDSVARAALALLDEVGLPDLSMRRIAARLEVQPSALYWHFASKQLLLAELADRITARVPIAESDPVACARGIRDALLAHRDGAELVLSTSALGLGSAHAERALLRSLPEQNPERAAALLHFILGHTALVQQRMHAHSHGAASGDDDPTAGLDRVFDLGVTAIAGLSATRPRARA
ncbi:TetR family transcriptional regulator [Microbacterium sp.]|uniref:TetR family transcriptional regulator n=1 Tax=Microbacterium sp. TaxID=51671 RepID=UPI0039E363E7